MKWIPEYLSDIQCDGNGPRVPRMMVHVEDRMEVAEDKAML